MDFNAGDHVLVYHRRAPGGMVRDYPERGVVTYAPLVGVMVRFKDGYEIQVAQNKVVLIPPLRLLAEAASDDQPIDW